MLIAVSLKFFFAIKIRCLVQHSQFSTHNLECLLSIVFNGEGSEPTSPVSSPDSSYCVLLIASLDFEIEIVPLQNAILGTLLCLIAVGVGSIINRVLVVLQKTNNVVVRCHLCWVPFLGGGIFNKRAALFVTLCQWVLSDFSHFDQAPLLDISSYVTWPSHVL